MYVLRACLKSWRAARSCGAVGLVDGDKVQHHDIRPYLVKFDTQTSYNWDILKEMSLCEFRRDIGF